MKKLQLGTIMSRLFLVWSWASVFPSSSSCCWPLWPVSAAVTGKLSLESECDMHTVHYTQLITYTNESAGATYKMCKMGQSSRSGTMPIKVCATKKGYHSWPQRRRFFFFFNQSEKGYLQTKWNVSIHIENDCLLVYSVFPLLLTFKMACFSLVFVSYKCPHNRWNSGLKVRIDIQSYYKQSI